MLALQRRPFLRPLLFTGVGVWAHPNWMSRDVEARPLQTVNKSNSVSSAASINRSFKCHHSISHKLSSHSDTSLLSNMSTAAINKDPSTVSKGPSHETKSPSSQVKGPSVPTVDASDSYILVDIGANLTNRKFVRDIDNVLQRAREVGVQKIMVTGTSINGSKEALRLTRLFPDVLYSTAGVHPHDAKLWDEESEAEIVALCSNGECVAVGECGLDFNRNFSPRDVQLEVFEKQVAIACRLKKPLFVHERDAHDEMVQILSKYTETLPPTVIHCFTGTTDHAKTYLSMGLYLGLTGYIWKDKTDNGVRRILTDNILPLDRMLLETDAPFMFPNTRSAKLTADMKQNLSPRAMNHLTRHCTFQRNEPCSLAATLEMIAGLMGKPPEEVAMATTYNAVKIFGLSS